MCTGYSMGIRGFGLYDNVSRPVPDDHEYMCIEGD